MPVELSSVPGGVYAVLGLIVAGITWAVETFVQPLGTLGKLAYAVAALLIIAFALLLLFSIFG